MGTRWDDITVQAPCRAVLGDTGIVLAIDRPIVGSMGFLFADIHTDGAIRRTLIEPRYTITINDVGVRVTGIDGDMVTIAWRTRRPGLPDRLATWWRHNRRRRRSPGDPTAATT